MPRSPSDYLVRLQDSVAKLLEKNGTKMPAFNDPLDAIVARYALAKVMAKACEELEKDAKEAVQKSPELAESIGMLSNGAPAMNVYSSHFASLNAEKRGRQTYDNKKLLAGLSKLAADNPKIADRINNIIEQSKTQSYALYLTPTLNAMPE